MKSKPSHFVLTECASSCHSTYEMSESSKQWYSALTYFWGLIRWAYWLHASSVLQVISMKVELSTWSASRNIWKGCLHLTLNSSGKCTLTLSIFRVKLGDVWEVRNATVWVSNSKICLYQNNVVSLKWNVWCTWHDIHYINTNAILMSLLTALTDT